MTDRPPSPYWFHAKTYGWGWGLPARREGWIVSGVWLAMILAVTPFLAGRHWIAFAVFMAVMTVGILAVCWLKGEPPRWR